MYQVREAILTDELKKVEEFLALHDLTLDKDIDKTLYLLDDDKIIGTISKAGSIMKCIAVDKSYQGEDLTGLLINKIVEKLSEENIFSYQLFTKIQYKPLFTSLGFNTIVESEDAVMMEKGFETIYEKLDEMKSLIRHNLGKINPNSDIAATVLNANPFTLGHQYLIEEMVKNHDKVILFLVEEDKSEFSFKERMALAYLSTARFKNVVIIPSSKYMVSSLTFPSYFIHETNKKYKNIATMDAKIFKDYFMTHLYIKKRYVGSESKDYMIEYNKILKLILGDSLVEVPRLTNDEGLVYSASLVRNLIKENKIDEALKLIPNECSLIFKGLVKDKYASR